MTHRRAYRVLTAAADSAAAQGLPFLTVSTATLHTLLWRYERLRDRDKQARRAIRKALKRLGGAK